MDLAALATPTDLAKLAFLKQTFREVVHMLKTLDFPEESVRDALPIMKAAANACIFDGEYDGVVRKFYAFRGDNTRVWFTMDLFTAMPSSMRWISSRSPWMLTNGPPSLPGSPNT